MSNIVSIITVAVLGVIGNIAYFEYKTRKKTSKDLLKERLTKLLLPLYVVIHVDEKAEIAWATNGDGDHADFYSRLPGRLLPPIIKIIRENIYLADDTLHTACIDFLEWAYMNNENDRFQKLMSGDFDELIQDKDFKNFSDIVKQQYEEIRHLYLTK